ncbi:VWA domain-containing protein [Endozoicomonas gorgoniicola]|uniref:VWA domain-containing protein n=1 Tax=Endozoicomonas gorgoniicola TaxID=1234144 RepID=A0ABT3MXZ0_9GAMM|nr:VWA domain-containing protein [Endozoicomonas gorgoniicola]MCW7554227.1 VWA domain-containing protein [Endozoicomonas gorgoniicola]
MNKIKRLIHFFTLFIALSVTLPLQADDTDVFLGGTSRTRVDSPNILFVLDNSGSMLRTVTEDNKSRAEVIREGLIKLINELEAVNIGLMVFSTSGLVDSYGRPISDRLLYPIAPVENVRPGMIDFLNNFEPVSYRINTPLGPALMDASKYFDGSFKHYTCPVTEQCQNNHIVLLTDGQPSDFNISRSFRDFSGITGCTGYNSAGNRVSRGEWCVRELADYMATTGGSVAKSVKVHTIGFALGESNKSLQTKIFLDDVAKLGQGKYAHASNAENLKDILGYLKRSVLDKSTTYTVPGVTANNFSNAYHLNSIFFSLFTPSLNDRWNGNVKKYRLKAMTDSTASGSSTLRIVDSNGANAIDPGTGFFKSSSKSYWSDINDGNDVALGGVSKKLPTKEDRKVYTYLGQYDFSTPVDLTEGENSFTASNPGLTPDLFNLAVGDTSGKNTAIDWLRDPDKDLGDPMHSVPGVATYRCQQFDEGASQVCPEDKQDMALFFGTNDGQFHAVNAQTGSEYFSFIPKEILPKLPALQKNQETIRTKDHGRIYGIDGSVTLWVNDVNRNGVIFGGMDTLDQDGDGKTTEILDKSTLNSGEHIYAYIGMRRGGRHYYAFDVTRLDKPKLLWVIEGGKGDFAQLGQTWSKPIATKVRFKGEDRKVLFFTGGNDTNQDYEFDYKEARYGNAIFMVDATTGELLWSAGGQAQSLLPRMDASGYKAWSSRQYYRNNSVSGIDCRTTGAWFGFEYEACVMEGDYIYKARRTNIGERPSTSPDTWEKIGTIKNQKYSHNLNLSKMKYSMPGGVRVADIDFDGYADQLFAADTRGQVWRFFINNCIKNQLGCTSAAIGVSEDRFISPSDSDGDGVWAEDEGVFAVAGVKDNPERQTKIYVEPDVSLSFKNGKMYMAIGIGTGSRPDPTSRYQYSYLKNRFYVYLTPHSAMLPLDQSGVISGQRVPSHTIITDYSANLVSAKDLPGERVIDRKVSDWTGGWYIDLDDKEQVLSPATTFNGLIYFNTYRPPSEDSGIPRLPCQVVAGSSRAYTVHLSNGAAAFDNKRFTNLKTPGIPPSTRFFFIKNDEGGTDSGGTAGTESLPVTSIGGNSDGLLYWKQEE